MARVPFWDVINALGPLKRDIAVVFKLAADKDMRPVLIPLLFNKNRGKILNKLCEAFNDKAMQAITFKYLKEEYYSLPVKEIIGFSKRLLVNLGVEEYNADRTAKTIGMMFENDQAYAWRFQDMMTEATEKLKTDTYTEAKRLVSILIERDPDPKGLIPKYEAILKILKYIKYFPSINKALKKALEPLNIENCKLTEADIYHTLLYGSYNIQGKSQEERLKIYETYHPDKSKWPARWSLG